jgi:hypothetical protein
MSSKPGEHLQTEPQSERGEPGSRDTGADGPGGGPADRPAGSFEHEEVQSTDKDSGTDDSRES